VRDDSVELAAQELALGRPERARTLLTAVVVPDGPADERATVLLGVAEYQSGNFAGAGEIFAQSAQQARGERRGVLLARAGDALERAGRRDDTVAAYYREAGVRLPLIAGWLAVREASLTDDVARALTLLRRAPPEAERFASRTRAAVFLAAGDSARALVALGRAEEWTHATVLAAALSDTVRGREFAFRAMESGDTVGIRIGLEFVSQLTLPPTGRELYVVASAHRQMGRLSDAIGGLESALQSGDSSSATLRRLGDLLSSAGQRSRALEVYGVAMRETDSDGALAEYRRARLLTRVGRAAGGYTALGDFATHHPTHASAPAALQQISAWHRRGGRPAQADSVLRAIARRWPESETASRARMALANDMLDEGDTVAAREWYWNEVSAGGAQQRAAQYFLADLDAHAGDSASASEAWRRLAREDSVGYYGTIARDAAGLAKPAFATPGVRTTVRAVQLTLQRVDVLLQVGFDEEAEEVVRRRFESAAAEGDEALALAEGLIERGWMQEGLRLGWRAAQVRTLNDWWVLRAIFPWPLRELIEDEAREHGLDPYLVAALIRQESAFRPTIVSRAGAHGLMQLMPATASWVAGRQGIAWDRRYLTSAAANLHIGSVHLAALLRTYDGNVIAALAAYNAGSRAVARWRRSLEATDPVRFVEGITYRETRGYVRTVLRNWDLYRGLYPTDKAAVDQP
jgi:soluble lytic murein transglycosylase